MAKRTWKPQRGVNSLDSPEVREALSSLVKAEVARQVGPTLGRVPRIVEQSVERSVAGTLAATPEPPPTSDWLREHRGLVWGLGALAALAIWGFSGMWKMWR